MTVVPLICLVAAGSYLLGAVPFGYLVARARGVNILEVGSGNIGATNVGRMIGTRFGILVFLLDFAKGAGPVYLARLLPQPAEVPPHTLPVVAGVAAFLGHLFPVYLRFRGGKGVATGAGVIAVLVPVLTVIVLAAWGGLLFLTRYVSIASVSAAALLFALRVGFTEHPWGENEVVITLFCLIGAVLVLVRHQSNLRRLFAGTEPRFGSPHT